MADGPLEATALEAMGGKAGALATLARTPGRPVGVHVAVGSYERVLFGLEVVRPDEGDAAYRLRPLFAYAPHTGCIKALAAGDHYMASGSTDEVIRCGHTHPHAPTHTEH
jgi:hypothetical protein